MPDAPKLNRTRVVAEFVAAFGVLMLIDAQFCGGTRFAGVEPHPYWLVVALAATVYGSGTGFVVAAAASLLWLSGPHADFRPGEDYFVHVFTLTLLPLLWMSVALLIGEIVSARQRRLEAVVAQARDLSRSADVLSARFGALIAVNRELQVSIVTNERTATHVLDIAGQLAAPEPLALEQTIAAMIAMASAHLEFALYLLVDGELMPAIVECGKGATPPDLRGSALLTAVVREGKVVHIGEPIGQKLLSEVGSLAMPVRLGRGGEGIGLLLFTALPLTAFTEIRLSELSAVSGWLSEIIGHRLALLTPLARATSLVDTARAQVTAA